MGAQAVETTLARVGLSSQAAGTAATQASVVVAEEVRGTGAAAQG